MCRGFPGIQGLGLCALTARTQVQSPVEELRLHKSHSKKKIKCVCVCARTCTHMCTGLQPAGHAHTHTPTHTHTHTHAQALPLCEARRDVLPYKCTLLCTLRECKHSWGSGKMTDLEIRGMRRGYKVFPQGHPARSSRGQSQGDADAACKGQGRIWEL